MFDLMTKKQKLFEYKFNYSDVEEKKIKESTIYRPYDHLQASGFTFENKTEKETSSVLAHLKSQPRGQNFQAQI